MPDTSVSTINSKTGELIDLKSASVTYDIFVEIISNQVLFEIISDSPKDVNRPVKLIVPLFVQVIQSKVIEMEIDPVLFAAMSSGICKKIVNNDDILEDNELDTGWKNHFQCLN